MLYAQAMNHRIFKAYPVIWIAVFVLEVQIILKAFLAELRGSDVHANLNLACVASLLYGKLQQLQTCGKNPKPIIVSI